MGGLRVLVTSTDPAHSLADALAQPLADAPTPVEVGAAHGRLQAQQIDAQARLERHWGAVRGYLTTVLAAGGLDEVRAEELVLLPGLDELFSLIDLRHRVVADEHDLIVVDCAPTAETLRLLALPDALRWYADRLLSSGRRLARVARPLGRSGGAGMPVPDDEVFDVVERVHRDLAGVHDLLQDSANTSVRLVTAPERLAVAETMRTATSLSLFGYAIDAVLVNRVLPDQLSDPYLTRWQAHHTEQLQRLRDAFAPLPVLEAPLQDDEPIGVDALGALATVLHGQRSPEQVFHHRAPLRLERDGEGHRLSLVLPFAVSDDLELHRKGDQLHLRVAGVRRSLTLPAALHGAEVAGAHLRDGVLELRFTRSAAEVVAT